MEKDARETKARMDAENKALKDKLDKEAAELKKKLQVRRFAMSAFLSIDYLRKGLCGEDSRI